MKLVQIANKKFINPEQIVGIQDSGLLGYSLMILFREEHTMHLTKKEEKIFLEWVNENIVFPNSPYPEK